MHTMMMRSGETGWVTIRPAWDDFYNLFLIWSPRFFQCSTAMAEGDGKVEDDYCRDYLPANITEKVEAGAFRCLCRHLQERSDVVSNMELMTLSGFCRNCLAKVSREITKQQFLSSCCCGLIVS